MDGQPINHDEDERELLERDDDSQDPDRPERMVYARLLGYEAAHE